MDLLIVLQIGINCICVSLEKPPFVTQRFLNHEQEEKIFYIYYKIK